MADTPSKDAPKQALPSAPSAPVVPINRVVQPMAEGDFSEKQFKQLEYVGYAKAGTTIEDMLKREYWAHVAAKLRPMTRLIIMTEDRRLYVEFIAFAVGSNWAEVRQFGKEINVDKVSARGSVADDYEISDGGLVKEWQIVRKSDGRVIKGDGTLKNEDEARKWLGEYLRAQGLRAA